MKTRFDNLKKAMEYSQMINRCFENIEAQKGFIKRMESDWPAVKYNMLF